MRSDASDQKAILPLPAQMVLLLLLTFAAVYIWNIQQVLIHHSHFTLGEAIYRLHDVTLYNLNEWLAQWL